MNAQRLAAKLLEIAPDWDEAVETRLSEFVREVRKSHSKNVICEALTIFAAEKERAAATLLDEAAELERRATQRAAEVELFEGCPDGTTFRQACEIKAAQGNKLAQQYVSWWESRQYRIEDAILDAAIGAHPGWERGEQPGHFKKLDDDAPDAEALIEWFYKNYPVQAREIENRIT